MPLYNPYLSTICLFEQDQTSFQVHSNQVIHQSIPQYNCNNKMSQPKTHSFPLNNTNLTISSDFDSGNIALVKQLSHYHYVLQCVDDATFTSTPVNSKSWFYFQVTGAPKHAQLMFKIQKVQALSAIYYSKYSKYYRPVYRVGNGQWQRFRKEVPINSKQNGELQCVLEYTVDNSDQPVEFAFCYPYQFSKHLAFIQDLQCYQGDQRVYCRTQVITQSPEQRPVHLITITSPAQPQSAQDVFNNQLFPQLKPRPSRFKRPVVLITARVHPGQTPASYAMQGVINFLTNKQDLRAQLLRKMFVFMIVPMINVDGVFHGHFRMDTFGKNLNRFYINPCPQQQPAIYAIKQLANYLKSEDRLSFYFDLHGHNAKKGNFIYGNAFSNFVEQVESQIFCKLLSINHPGFEYEYCNFSEKHMNAKDRFESLTKQGCGRVVMHKNANIIHSYSLQCGILSANSFTTAPQVTNADFEAKDLTCQQNNTESTQQQIRLPDNSIIFSQNSYRELGKNLMVSILDVFDKNPYNRIYNSKYKSMQMLRRLTAFEIFHATQRFRMFERFTFGKVKNINSLIQDIMNRKVHYRQLYNTHFQEDQQLGQVEWPRNIMGLAKTKAEKIKKIKQLSEAKGEEDENNYKSAKQIKAASELREEFEAQIKQINKKETLILQLAPNDECGLGQATAKRQIMQSIKMTEHLGNHQQLKHSRQRYTSLTVPKQSTFQNTQGHTVENTQRQTIRELVDFNHRPHVQATKTISLQDEVNDDSDLSQEGQNQINKQLLNLCENQNQQGIVLNKIMLNDFDQHDYQQLEQKYNHKNHQEAVIQQPEVDKINMDGQADKVDMNDQSYKKQGKIGMRPSKRINNTYDVYSKYKAKTRFMGSNPQPTSKTFQGRNEVREISKLTAAEEFRRNIYDTIKQEIKEGLRREYQRKKQREKIEVKLMDSFRLKSGQKVRGGHNLVEHRRMKSKVKLPSLGSNMYIITTSTRLINKL